MGELADRGRLAGAVDAVQENARGRATQVEVARSLRHRRQRGRAESRFGLFARARGAGPNGCCEASGHRWSHVRGDQHIFELFVVPALQRRAERAQPGREHLPRASADAAPDALAHLSCSPSLSLALSPVGRGDYQPAWAA